VNPSATFIRRPVATSLLMAAILLFGASAYRTLPVSDLPNVDFPVVLVTAVLPGASAETMASAVATPLEREFSTIAGLDNITSSSSLGSTQVTLQFSMERDIDSAALDVQAAIAAATPFLPPSLPSPPTYTKVNPADLPIQYIALSSPTMPLAELNEYAETMLAQRISMVSGVAQVQVFGAQKYAVRVQVSPAELATRGIGINEVATAIAAANVNLPTGSLDTPARSFTIETTGQLERAAEYNPVIVAFRNGSPVRIEDIGRAVDSVENDKVAAWYNGQRAVVLAVARQPGSNTVAVADAVEAVLPRFRKELPASVVLEIVYSRADMIERSVEDVKFTLWLTLGLVVLVIFAFLRSVRATLVPSLALPLSITGTFAVMLLLGYTLNNLSLMALMLSLGFVVDDAIVMLENIVRHTERGQPRLQAAFDGSAEIAFTIVSMTLSLAAVFIPVLFMGGLLGRLFREFAVTIAVAILISGAIALTLSPMLCARLLKWEPSKGSQALPRGSAGGEAAGSPRDGDVGRDAGEETRAHGRAYRASQRAFAAGLHWYERGLRWSLDHRWTMIALSALVLVLSFVLFRAIPKGLLPTEDTGQLFAATEGPEGISFAEMARHQQMLAEIVRRDPAVEAVVSSAGARPGGSYNSGVMFMRLKPRSQRDASADEVVERLRPQLAAVPGIRAFLQNPSPIRLSATLTKSQYQYTLRGIDMDQLYRVAQALEARMRGLPILRDVTSDLQLRNPVVVAVIDRDQAAAVGLSAQQIEEALWSAYGTRQVSDIYAANNTYRVILEVLPEFQRGPEALGDLYLRSTGGQLVPLQAVAGLRQSVGPLTINHSGQLPAVTLSFNLPAEVSLGEAVGAVERLAREVVPPGSTITTSFQGTAQFFQASLGGMGFLLLLAVAVIYIVLGILYESTVHPLTILSALPFAGFGALVTLLIFNRDLSLYAFVGIVMLVGLVKKNGIIMIDFALDAQRDRKMSAHDAIVQACLVRFRPIMMTTMSALMGTLPIAVGWGAGAESRQPLGLAVMGGLVFSQSLTLFVTPVFFVLFDRLTGRRKPASPSEVTPG
jgi:HAE1 family hydrophobic/amphiphilic exporter-1